MVADKSSKSHLCVCSCCSSPQIRLMLAFDRENVEIFRCRLVATLGTAAYTSSLRPNTLEA